MRVVDAVAWACVLCGCHIQMTEWICIKFCINLEHSSMETIRMVQKAADRGNWGLAASTWQDTNSYQASRGVFGETSNHLGNSAPLRPRFGALWLLNFSRTKITFERKEISDWLWDSGSWWQLQQRILWSGRDAGRTVWGPKVPTLKGTEGSVSYVQCFLYLVSSSINVSTFIGHGWILSGHTSLLH